MVKCRWWHAASLAGAIPTLAHGQATAPVNPTATSENALRSAADAFGTSVGRETIGLYSTGDVRGFSPITAGNVRIEGLYIDPAVVPNGRLVGGSSIKVGISAQGYPYPAPTGIVDYTLRRPGSEPSATATLGGNLTAGAVNGDVDLRLPFNSSLGLTTGASFIYDFPQTIEPVFHGGAALALHWRPTPETEIIPFWSHFVHRDDPAQPRFVVNGDYLPPEIDRENYLVQPWALNDVDDSNIGLIARSNVGPWRIAGGIFRSLRSFDVNYSDQFLAVDEQGNAARHRVVATPPQRPISLSGELRVSRDLVDGPRAHRVHLALRGRSNERVYGGSAGAELGPAFMGDPDIRPKPAFLFGPQSRDRVRQASAGIAYEGRWQGVGELAVSLQRVSYRKSVEIPGRVTPDSREKPWLYSGALAVHLQPTLAAYASYTRGLEESAAAPDLATNRDEAPPALITRQVDAGLRWSISPRLRLIGGLFDVRKPYFSLDHANVYRRLGDVRHRGAEISLAGAVTPHLQVVAGAVLLDAEVTGDARELGTTGKRPFASTGRTVILSGEYSLPQVAGLSFDAAIQSYGRRVANTANSLFLPATTSVDAGLRYRWQMDGRPVVLRVQASNLLNNYEWELRSSNAFYFAPPRQLTARLSMDF